MTKVNVRKKKYYEFWTCDSHVDFSYAFKISYSDHDDQDIRIYRVYLTYENSAGTGRQQIILCNVI